MSIFKKTLIVCCAVASLSACTADISAMSVCQKLETSGIASNCKEALPGGIGANASERVSFDLPSVPGKGGQVLRFDRADLYENTAKAFEALAFLAGPHRYGSKKNLIFVQMNNNAPLEVGKKTKTLIEGL